MDNFKQASRLKLKIQTPKGLLTVEQLWDLNITELDQVAVAMEEAVTKSGTKSFIVKQTDKDKTAQLRFEIALDILRTKVEEADAHRIARENKEHNEKILAIIKDKKDSSLKDLSIEALEKQLK